MKITYEFKAAFIIFLFFLADALSTFIAIRNDKVIEGNILVARLIEIHPSLLVVVSLVMLGFFYLDFLFIKHILSRSKTDYHHLYTRIILFVVVIAVISRTLLVINNLWLFFTA